jgi:hypothetical protein
MCRLGAWRTQVIRIDGIWLAARRLHVGRFTWPKQIEPDRWTLRTYPLFTDKF